ARGNGGAAGFTPAVIGPAGAVVPKGRKKLARGVSRGVRLGATKRDYHEPDLGTEPLRPDPAGRRPRPRRVRPEQSGNHRVRPVRAVGAVPGADHLDGGPWVPDPGHENG